MRAGNPEPAQAILGRWLLRLNHVWPTARCYTLDQVGVPPAQLTANYFPGPHGVYAGEANLKRFNEAVRVFACWRGERGRAWPTSR